MTLNKLINYLILVLVFVSLFSTAAIRIIVGILVILWILENNFKEKIKILKKILKNKALLFFVLFFFWMFLSIFWSNNIYGGYWSGYFHNAFDYFIRNKLFYLIIVFIILTSFNIENMEKVVKVFLLGMFISEIVSYLLIFRIIPEFGFLKGSYNDPSPFLNHSLYSFLLVIFIFTLLNKTFNEKIILKKIIYIFFTITATLNLFFNGGRTGQLIFIFSGILFLILKFKTKIKFIFIGVISLIIAFILALNISPIFKNRIYQAKNDIIGILKNNYNSSWGGRFLSILLVKDIMKENNHLIGIGIGNSRNEVFEKLENNYPQAYEFYSHYFHSDMHNEYAQTFLEEGIIGIILLLLIFYELFRLKIYNEEFNVFFKIFIFTYFLAFFTGNFLTKMLTSEILFFIFISIAIKCSVTYYETNNTQNLLIQKNFYCTKINNI